MVGGMIKNAEIIKINVDWYSRSAVYYIVRLRQWEDAYEDIPRWLTTYKIFEIDLGVEWYNSRRGTTYLMKDNPLAEPTFHLITFPLGLTPLITL